MRKMNFIKPLLLSVWSISIINCNNVTDKRQQGNIIIVKLVDIQEKEVHIR